MNLDEDNLSNFAKVLKKTYNFIEIWKKNEKRNIINNKNDYINDLVNQHTKKNWLKIKFSCFSKFLILY